MVRGPWSVVLSGVVVLAALAACGPAETAAPLGERPLNVVATTSLIADLAREIGGEHVAVEGLMGPGVDPHLYRPRESDVSRLVGADVVLYNGLDLEGKMGEALEQVAGRGVAVEPVAESVGENRLLTPPEFEGAFDPHLWMDVGLWREVAASVARTLAAVDTANADAYAANLRAYDAELAALDAWVREQVEVVPEGQRVLVTAHDAFNYFGRAYGFEVRGLQGLSTATEAGTADVSALAAFVAERRIPAMFVETSVSPRSIEAVRAAVRDRGFEVEIGGSLFSDALGDPGTPEGTYVGMIRHNVGAVVGALGGEAGDGEGGGDGRGRSATTPS